MIGRFLVLALMGAVVGFEIYAIAQVVRSPLRGKWKWILLALVGVTQLHVAWEPGVVWYSPISVSFLGVAAIRSGAGPWVLSVSFPVGAVMALRKVEAAGGEGRREVAGEATDAGSAVVPGPEV